LLDQDRGVALVDSVGLKVFGRHRPRREDGVGTDGEAGTNKSTGADPGTLLHLDRHCDQVKGRSFEIVITCAEEGPLGNAHIICNRYRREVQQPTFLSQPDVIPQGQLPGKGDLDIRLNNDSPPHASAKEPQDLAFQRRQFERA